MTHEVKIHSVQTLILRELLFVPVATFAGLKKVTGLDGDHFKFHIARLVELGYVLKVTRGNYTLTPAGKEYANKLDTDQNTIERQPKSAVILVIERAVAKRPEYLVQERLKHPYFGFWGFPGGKIRWGETIMECAARELFEETGLRAKLLYRGVYHEHVISSETNEFLEDKIFHVVFGDVATGKLVEQFEGGRNAWLALEDIRSKQHVYKSFDAELAVGLGARSFVELKQVYTKEQF